MKRTQAILIASALALVVAGGIGIAIAVATSPSSHEATTQKELFASSSSSSAAPPAASAEPSPTETERATPPREHGGGAVGGSTAIAAPPEPETPRILAGAAPPISNALGKLAASFPETVPPAPQSTIQSSSLTSESTQVQLTLTARTTLSSDELLEFYRAQFAAYGLHDVPVPAVEGSTALLFTRDDDSITLTVTPVDGGMDYIVFGALTARG